MTAPPGHPRQTDSARAPQAGHASSITGPLLLWLTVQLLALLLAVLRVPLAAQHPQPAELLAAQILVVVQVTAAALLFPYLLRSAHTTAAVAVTTFPFLVLAGMLSAVPGTRLTVAGSYVIAWIVALWILNLSFLAGGRPIGVAGAALLTVGTLVAFYLRLDLGMNTSAEPDEPAGRWAPLSPSVAALSLLSSPAAARDWCAPALVLGVALVRRVSGLRNSQVIHTR